MPPINQKDNPLAPKRNLIKRRLLLLIIGGILLVTLIALGVFATLSSIMSDKSGTQTSQSIEEQAAIHAKQYLDEAQKYESTGKTEDAITSYKQSLAEYQKAGDRSGEEGVKLQIQYLESLKQ